MSNQSRILTLKCPSCGADLDISAEMDTFYCGFCGTRQMVQRRGGTVSLKLVGEAIARVQAGTDRTAAELALIRLGAELEALQSVKTELAYRKNARHNKEPSKLPALFILCIITLIFGFLANIVEEKKFEFWIVVLLAGLTISFFCKSNKDIYGRTASEHKAQVDEYAAGLRQNDARAAAVLSEINDLQVFLNNRNS